MRLWLLSHLEASPGNQRFLEAAREAGHEVRRIVPAELGLLLAPAGGGERLRFLLRGLPLEPPDAVFTRLGGSAPDGAFDALRQLEEAGIPCVNPPGALALARDKIATSQRLAAAGVPHPPTAVLGPKSDGVEAAVDFLGPPPWILKLPRSTQGLGVVRVDSLASLRSVLDMLQHLGQRVLLQQYVREAAGMDIRVLVVGNDALAAMHRRAVAGDEIRSNLHRGGVAEPIALSESLAELAVRSSRALGLSVCGVDLLPGRDGPVVAEVNGSPGLEGLERATGLDLAACIVSALPTLFASRRGQTTGEGLP